MTGMKPRGFAARMKILLWREESRER